MSVYINTVTGEYPRHIGDILIEHPNADPNGAVLPEGWAVVENTVAPDATTYDPVTQVAYQLPPAYVNGKYQMRWSVRQKTQEEIDKENIVYVSPAIIVDEVDGSEPTVIG